MNEQGPSVAAEFSESVQQHPGLFSILPLNTQLQKKKKYTLAYLKGTILICQLSKRLEMGFDRGSWPPSPGNRILQRLHHTCCTAKTSPGGLLSQALGTAFVLRQRAPMGSPQTLQCPQCLSQALSQLLGTEGRRYLPSWRLLQWEKGVTKCPVLRLGLALIAYQCHLIPLTVPSSW